MVEVRRNQLRKARAREVSDRGHETNMSLQLNVLANRRLPEITETYEWERNDKEQPAKLHLDDAPLQSAVSKCLPKTFLVGRPGFIIAIGLEHQKQNRTETASEAVVLNTIHQALGRLT